MAEAAEDLSSDERVRRSVARTVRNLVVLLLALAGAAAWAWLGFYQLDPGQAAIVLRLGRHVDTVSETGLHWHLPPPFETHEVVNVARRERQEFGFRGAEESSPQELLEASMQTGDNNSVRLSFVVRYQIKDAFAARYSLQNSVAALRDAAQAAVREVVGRLTIEEVISQGRSAVEADSEEILQRILDSYGAGLLIDGVELQEVQPPAEVRASFDDVIAAAQDASRAVNEAQGYENELVPRARAEAQELIERANAYQESRVADATGEAERFKAIVAEYRKAPEVTQKRLYLETLEAILPAVEKVIIEPGTATVLPYLPLGRGAPGSPP